MGVTETGVLVQLQSCECKCRLNESVFNCDEKWTYDKCQWDCKEWDNWNSCINDYSPNSIKGWCEFSKVCKTDEYLDICNSLCKNGSLVN